MQGGGGCPRIVAIVAHCYGLLAVDLEMLPEGGGVGVGLVAPSHVAVVRLVRGVDVHMLLPITGVGEPSVTSFHLALKRFLA